MEIHVITSPKIHAYAYHIIIIIITIIIIIGICSGISTESLFIHCFQIELEFRSVDICRAWYNGSYTMATKPIKFLELHYTMTKFLKTIDSREDSKYSLLPILSTDGNQFF